jgi:hypothetical protein
MPSIGPVQETISASVQNSYPSLLMRNADLIRAKTGIFTSISNDFGLIGLLNKQVNGLMLSQQTPSDGVANYTASFEMPLLT